MKATVVITALLGLAATVLLIALHNATAVMNTLVRAGWQGMLAVSLAHVVTLVCTALAWKAALIGSWNGSTGVFIRSRWIREGVNDLLPVAQIGGEVVGARVQSLHGAPPRIAAAGVAVDLTLEVLSEFVFTLLGVGLLLLSGAGGAKIGLIEAWLGIISLAIAGFIFAQRRGLFLLIERMLEWIANRFGWASLTRISGLHDSVGTLYRKPRNIALGLGLHLLGWMLGTVEIWLALYFMGHPLNLVDCFVLESLGQAVKSMGFAIPGALGVQEGSLMLLGSMFGLSPEVGLALSLIKRARALLLGIPALLVWQFHEGQRLSDAFREAGEEANRS